MVEVGGPRPRPTPQVQAYLDTLAEPFPRLDVDVAALRLANRNLIVGGGGSPEPVSSVEDVEIGHVRGRLYKPKDAHDSVLVWFHGGGWVVGDLDATDLVARALANRSGSSVLCIDYRLAPEHRFPSGLEDCWAATLWASTEFKQVAVGGDSAGGNLAAAVALRARDGGVRLKLQLLVYPNLQPGTDTPAYRDFAERYSDFAGMKDFGLAYQRGLAWHWDQYVPDVHQRGSPDASPLLAASVADVAPALIIEGEHDILRPEGEEYAARLRDEGVEVRLLVYEGQVHGFFTMLGLMDDAKSAVRESGAALRAAFSGRPPRS